MKIAVGVVPHPHERVFDEAVLTLERGLHALGHETYTGFEYPETEDLGRRTDLRIVLNSHQGGDRSRLPTDSTILYNFEQHPERFMGALAAYRVWDYSAANVKLLRSAGIDAHHVPLGYVPELERITPAEVEDIDVLFYGSMNDRRFAILEQLEAAGLTVKSLFDCYGEERDAWIARAKIVLNVHFYEAQLLEMPRLQCLFANQRFVISEKDSEGLWCKFSPGCNFADYGELVDHCRYFAKDEQAEIRARRGRWAQADMRGWDEPAILREAMVASGLG